MTAREETVTPARLRELRSARASTTSEMRHASRMGRPTRHYEESIRRLSEMIAQAERELEEQTR